MTERKRAKARVADIPLRLVNSVASISRVQVVLRRIVKQLDPSVFASLWDGQSLPGQRVRPDIESHAIDKLLVGWLETDLVVADVGSRWGVLDVWRQFQPHVRVVGFEPDKEECERLTALEGSTGVVTFVPAALGPATGSATLYLTRSPACSSLYPPDEELIRHRPRLASMAKVGEVTVPLTTLDEWFQGSGLDHIDVLKLDTQGSELGVLQGSVAALGTVRLIEVEVEFNEMYGGQPLFADVDGFLRSLGFVLWRIKGMMHYGLSGVPSSAFSVTDRQYFDGQACALDAQGGQLFWAHAYYVRREVAFPEPGRTEWQQAVRDACGAQTFGFIDLALNLLRGAADVAPEGVRAQLDTLFT